MTERGPFNTEAKFSVTEAQAIADPELRAKYKDERIEAIKSGVPTWILRGFDVPTEMGERVVADYYAAGVLVGSIIGSDQDGYDVYGPEIEDDAGPHHLNGSDPVDYRSEAEKKLQDYIAETYLPFKGQQ